MRLFCVAVAALAGVLTAPAFAGIANISGAGGAIPASGSGGGGTWNGGSPTAMPTSPFESSVFISGGVMSVHSITFTDMVHSFMGDLQAVLYDPTGMGHNIFVRPGVGFNSSIFGSAVDFNGTYTFVESGGASLPTVTGGGTTILPSGEYNQTFQGSPTAAGSWESGSFNIHNTPLSQISGSGGTWTLRIYDWTGGDVGTLGGWTLNYVAIPAPATLALLGLAGIVSRGRRRG